MRRDVCRITWLCTAIFALLVAFAVPVAQAQQPPKVQVVQLDTSRFPEIDVYVSVTDAEGQPVTNIRPEDFRLSENGQFVRLVHAGRAGEQNPITAVLLIDKSGSMDYADKMAAARQAASAFVRLMRPEDTTGVIAFDTQVVTVQPLTSTKRVLLQAIEGIEPGGDTALYDALHAAVAMLEPVSGRRAIIAVTDGMNTAGQHTLSETLTLVSQHDISIYAVGLGDPSQGTADYSGIDEPTLQAIAEASRGSYAHTPTSEDLRSLYELLSYRIQNEYKLTYRSPIALRDGVNREIAVTVAASSGPMEVAAEYNPGGVIPEVQPRSTWPVFGLIFAGLAFLLVVPGIVGMIRSRAGGRGRVPERARSRGRGRAKGRVRLTGEPPSARKK